MAYPRPTHPYRVGMARQPQRVIEPDAIYEDMQTGPPTRIPREFPYSWNPVNGFDARSTGESRAQSSARMGGLFDDLIKAGQDLASGTVDDAKKVVGDRGSQAVQDFINSTAGKQLLDKVQDKATEGVTTVVKQQGINLIMLAVAGGAVGGAISSKLGKTGTVLALIVAGFAANRIIKAVAPPAKK